MKNIGLTLLMLTLCLSTQAQKLIGFKGGYNYSNVGISSTGQIDESRSLNSFHVGMTANIPFLIFSVQSSLLVTGKGSKVTHGDPNSTNFYVAKTNPIYLEIPTTFNLNLRLGSKTGFYFGIGPYLAMGIAGKNSVYGRNDSASFSSNKSISYTNDDPTTFDVDEGAAYGKLKRFDYGGTIGAGIFLKGIMVSAYYDFGIPKINSLSNSDQEDNVRNQTFGISAGILFGGD